MSAWIGPLGSLIEFKCPSAVESKSEDSHVYFTPLGGDVAVTRLGDGTRPRVWDVSVDAARPDHVAALQGLADGEWGPGPFVFIPPAAETLNLLGKRDALAMGVPGNGYVADRPGAKATLTTEGAAGAGYSATGSGTPAFISLGSAPVLPGVSVTGKVWAQALTGTTATVGMKFYTKGGALLETTPNSSSSSTEGEFLVRTATAPATAAYVTLVCRGAYLTRPQVTWTEDSRTWSPSAASQQVVVSPLSDSVRRATGTRGQEQITDDRFTVTELRA